MDLICCEHNVNCDPSGGPDSSLITATSCVFQALYCSSDVLKYCSESRQETIIWVLNNILSLSRTMARTSGLLEHLVFWDLRTTRTGQWAQDNNEDHLNTCLGLDVWLWGMLGYNWWFGNTIRDIYPFTQKQLISQRFLLSNVLLWPILCLLQR